MAKSAGSNSLHTGIGTLVAQRSEIVTLSQSPAPTMVSAMPALALRNISPANINWAIVASAAEFCATRS